MTVTDLCTMYVTTGGDNDDGDDDEGSGDDENVGLNEVCYCDIKKCPKLITNSLQSQGGGMSNQMGYFFFWGV